MMKKKERQRGSLTVEASLAIPLFLFFFLFVLSYIPVFTAQMMVESCMSQAAQSMAVQSYGHKKLEDSIAGGLRTWFAELQNNGDSTNAAFQADVSAWYTSEDETKAMAQKMFIAYLADGDEARADSILKNLDVKDGLTGLDFTGSKVEDGDLIISVKYTVDMKFMSFFGLGRDKMVIEKQVYTRMWSEGDYGGVGVRGA